MPAEAKHVSLDIEVNYPGYAPAEYARQVSGFVNLCAAKWSIDIYTGAWFLPYLSAWPTNRDYWYARYPYGFYPAGREYWTWEQLKLKLNAAPWEPGTTVPGKCRLWQISGDRLILPGTADRAMDINVFNGTLAELEAYAGMKFPGVPPVIPPVILPLTVEQRVDRLEKAAKAAGWNL